MKAFSSAAALCCLLHSLPALSYVPAGSVMTSRNSIIRADHASGMTAGGFGRRQQQRRQQTTAAIARRQEEGMCSSGGGGGSRSYMPRPGLAGRGTRSPGLRWHPYGRTRHAGLAGRPMVFRGGGLPSALFSSSSSAPPPPPSSQEGGDGIDSAAMDDAMEAQLREAIAVGAAAEAAENAGSAAAQAGSPSSISESGGGGAVDLAAEDGADAVGPGISWATVSGVVASQLAFVGLFAWIASSTIRQEVLSTFAASPSAAALGVAGMMPLLAYGLALDMQKERWGWVKKIDEATSSVALQIFGSERKVAKVTGIVIPLSILVGVCEECAFRGLLPLLIAAKTGLPTATVVALSAVIFGSLHAASVAYFLTATFAGVFFHGLLLSTGNIFVPVVAHAVYDAIALVRYHIKVTARKQE